MRINAPIRPVCWWFMLIKGIVAISRSRRQRSVNLTLMPIALLIEPDILFIYIITATGEHYAFRFALQNEIIQCDLMVNSWCWLFLNCVMFVLWFALKLWSSAGYWFVDVMSYFVFENCFFDSLFDKSVHYLLSTLSLQKRERIG